MSGIERGMMQRQQRQILQAAEDENQALWDDLERQQAERRKADNYNPTMVIDRLRGGYRLANWQDLG